MSTGHFWNRCIDAVYEKFETYSIWHKASDCEFDDGENAQTKVGAIKGITSDLNTTTTGYAADMTTVSKLNSSLESQPDFIYDETGKITGYKTKAGADTVFPFKSGMVLYDEIDYDSFTYTSPEKGPEYYNSYDFVAGGYYMEGDIVYVDVIFKTSTNNAQTTQQEFPPPVSEFTIYNTHWFNGSTTASSSNPYNILEHPNIPYNPDARAGTTFTSFAKSEQKLTLEGKITLPNNSYGKTWHFQFVWL